MLQFYFYNFRSNILHGLNPRMNVEDGKKEKKIFKWNNGEKIGELWEEIELNKGREKLH